AATARVRMRAVERWAANTWDTTRMSATTSDSQRLRAASTSREWNASSQFSHSSSCSGVAWPVRGMAAARARNRSHTARTPAPTPPPPRRGAAGASADPARRPGRQPLQRLAAVVQLGQLAEARGPDVGAAAGHDLDEPLGGQAGDSLPQRDGAGAEFLGQRS